MKTNSIRLIAVFSMAACCVPVFAHETVQKSPHPGFRPGSEFAEVFVDTVRDAAVEVFPSIYRTPDELGYSEVSQRDVVAYLNDEGITTARAVAEKLDPGELQGRGQFEFFQNDMQALGNAVNARESGADYNVVMEVLFPPERDGRLMVFGIHCYVLDSRGRDAFSFLLNSHHQAFVDAKMFSENASDEARAELISMATAVGLKALREQIHYAAEAIADGVTAGG